MLSATIQKIKRHSLWLSLLGHLLVLLMFMHIVFITKQDEPPESSSASAQAIPSYLSPSPAETPAAPTSPTPPTEVAPVPKESTAMKPIETAKDGIEKPVAKQIEKAEAPAKPKVVAKKPLHAQLVTFDKNDVPEDITSPRDQEPLHLVGESKIVKPLVRIIARALSKHLFYPRVAADFNLRGIVLVGFTLHPEGYVTGAKIVKSSGAGVLDDAAHDAVAAMSPIGDVHEYVAEPEFLVIGIIFG